MHLIEIILYLPLKSLPLFLVYKKKRCKNLKKKDKNQHKNPKINNSGRL